MKNIFYNIDIDMENIPDNKSIIYLGMGCFWGAEKLFWKIKGIHVTAVGYSSGDNLNPTYEEVCSGTTNHAEVVMIAYDLNIINTFDLLVHFWEGHNPTQGLRQGNDIGSQYRSMIITTNKNQKKDALKSKYFYEKTLNKYGFDKITTEIVDYINFFYAEDYHQQYLMKNPLGYCGLGGCNVKFEK